MTNNKRIEIILFSQKLSIRLNTSLCLKTFKELVGKMPSFWLLL